MVLNLFSHNKWCISGTPVSRGKMEDLYGLYLFLNAKPFCYKECFHSYLKPGYRDIMRRINHFAFDLMWRSTKANESVKLQMGVPEQVEKKVILHFSSVERHFYERQLESTVLAANAAMNDGKKSRKIDELSTHLHRLRAACCHPQVGTSGISSISNTRKKTKQNAVTIANGVLSMAQILDRLIDDAKFKAEESQRVFTLHTNALANLHKLKAEAQSNGSIPARDDELSLLKKGCDLYFEALNSQDKNSSPSYVIGEAILGGCHGFQSQNSIVRDGAATLLWRVRSDEPNAQVLPEMWSRFDFTGSMKKINSFVARPILNTNENVQKSFSNSSGNFHFIFPKDCVLQVSNPHLGGLYVDAIPFQMERPDMETTWQTFSGYRPNKSKNWRLLIKSYYDDDLIDDNNELAANVYTGLDVRLFEPDISHDNLQRMHTLANISVSLSNLSQKIAKSPGKEIEMSDKYSAENIQKTINEMQEESHRLETHYIEAARVIQQLSGQKLREHVDERKEIALELKELSGGDLNECEPWSIDLLSWIHLYGNSQLEESLCRHVERRLFELFDDPTSTKSRTFPDFSNLDGFNLALSMRLRHSAFHRNLIVPKCIEQIEKLSDHPSESEVLENR